MFELYKKVNKSIEYPRGAKKILEGENPFAEGPCLLCISAQDIFENSVFGLTKIGARMARVRVKGDNGARIDLSEIPVSFLSIKADSENVTEKNNVKRFIDNYIRPLIIDENGQAKTKENVIKAIRNINILANCNGLERTLEIIDGIEQALTDLEYKGTEIDEILSQISLLSFQTEVSLDNCKASTIDFHNTNDTEVEVNPDNITDEMIYRNKNSRNGESIEKIGKRIEVLISGEDSHEVSDYIENGKAMPVIVHTMVSSVLESSIKGKSLSINELYEKARTILERTDNGEKKENLINELDSSLNYGEGITRLSDRELRLIDKDEQTVESYYEAQSNYDNSKKETEKLKGYIDKTRKVAGEVCTHANQYRILEASGYQLNKEQKAQIENSETDKQTIEKQNEKITKLQKMLGRVLQFADQVRNSVFGKFFFRKAIKELPEGEDIEK